MADLKMNCSDLLCLLKRLSGHGFLRASPEYIADRYHQLYGLSGPQCSGPTDIMTRTLDLVKFNVGKPWNLDVVHESSGEVEEATLVLSQVAIGSAHHLDVKASTLTISGRSVNSSQIKIYFSRRRPDYVHLDVQIQANDSVWHASETIFH